MAAEKFLGSWKLVQSDNFEAFLKELEIHYVKRKLAFLVVPTVVFAREGSSWSMETLTHIKSVKVNFELQEEFEELTIDDRNLKTVFELTDEDTKLVQTQMNPKGIKAVITRTIVAKENGGQFIMMVDMVCNGVRSTAEFKKLN